MRRLTALTVLCCLLACTTGNAPTAGGSSTTDNPRTALVYGTALDADSVPIANATVRLRPADYLAQASPRGLTKRTIAIKELTTDEFGQFFMDSIEPGIYVIEITNKHSMAVSLICEVVPGGDTLDLGLHSLKPFAALHGTVAPDSTASNMRAAIYGLERSTAVDPVTGRYSFTDLPEGAWSIRIESSAPDLGAAIVDVPMVNAGLSDTVAIVTLQSFRREAYTEWAFSRTITINTSPTGANITGDVYDFPLLIRLDPFTFDFSGARSDGRDIRFAKNDGTPLRYEIERWNPAGRKAAVWVLMDTVYAANNSQSIVIYWGKPDAQDFSNGAAVFDTANGFSGVWHFDAASYTRDATALRNTAVDSHTISTSGIAGTARNFDSTFMYVPDNRTLEPPTLSLSLWCRPSVSRPPSGKSKFVHKGRPDYPFSSYAVEYHESDRFIPAFMVSTQDTSFTKGISPDVLRQGRWYHMTGVFDNTTRSGALYIDGTLIDSFTTPAPIQYYPELDRPLTFGCQNMLSRKISKAFVHADIDEIRLSRAVRSRSWIQLAYENARPGSRMVEIR